MRLVQNKTTRPLPSERYEPGEEACRTNFPVPMGKYYLADAGFSHCDALLVPYRGVQYHLAEWGHAAVW